jgi:hypothetical protein
MKSILLLAIVSLSACSSMLSPAQIEAKNEQDRINNERYLQSLYDPEYLADCEYYKMECKQ